MQSNLIESLISATRKTHRTGETTAKLEDKPSIHTKATLAKIKPRKSSKTRYGATFPVEEELIAVFFSKYKNLLSRSKLSAGLAHYRA